MNRVNIFELLRDILPELFENVDNKAKNVVGIKWCITALYTYCSQLSEYLLQCHVNRARWSRCVASSIRLNISWLLMGISQEYCLCTTTRENMNAFVLLVQVYLVEFYLKQ